MNQILLEIIISIPIILLGCCLAYLWGRNIGVADFTKSLIVLNRDWGLRNKKYEWKFYFKLPSYYKMLFSFKPLKLETYFSQDEIKDLLGG